MTLLEFAFAACAILFAPGPTNLLLAMGGASAGFARAVRLIPVELAAYLVVVVPLSIFGSVLIAQHPLLTLAMKLAAAVWIMILAVKLWLHEPGPNTAAVTPTDMFVTTLLNPKGPIFGLGLIPAGGVDAIPGFLAVFSLCVVASAMAWAAAGALLTVRMADRSRMPKLLRCSFAALLGFVSAGIGITALAG